MVLDNYSVHKANLVIQACEILNIKINSFTSPFPSLKSNRTSLKINKKKYMAYYLFDTTEFMEKLFEKEFYRIINRDSYYKKLDQ